MPASGALKSPAPTVAELNKRLAQLNEALAPLLARDVSTLTAELEAGQKKASSGADAETSQKGAVMEAKQTPADPRLAGKLQSAQLQASLAYVLLDLVWILLKVEGKDVQHHPVIADLKRVQSYLEKVQQVARGEDEGEKGKERAPAVDKGKAQRFIQGALGKRTIFAEDGSVQRVVDASSSEKTKTGSSGRDSGSGSASDGASDENQASKPRTTNHVLMDESSAAHKDDMNNDEDDETDEVWEKPISKKARREAQNRKAAQAKASGSSASTRVDSPRQHAKSQRKVSAAGKRKH